MLDSRAVRRIGASLIRADGINPARLLAPASPAANPPIRVDMLDSRAVRRIGASLIRADGITPARLLAPAGTWLFVCASAIAGVPPVLAAGSHAIAMHGAPALPADVTQF